MKQNTKTVLAIGGILKIEVWKGSILLCTVKAKNLFLEGGLYILSRSFHSLSHIGTKVAYLGVGTGTVTPTNMDLDLTNECHRQAISGFAPLDLQRYELQTTIPRNTSGTLYKTLREAGLWSNDGYVLFARVVHDAVYVDDGVTLVYRWQVYFRPTETKEVLAPQSVWVNPSWTCAYPGYTSEYTYDKDIYTFAMLNGMGPVPANTMILLWPDPNGPSWDTPKWQDYWTDVAIYTRLLQGAMWLYVDWGDGFGWRLPNGFEAEPGEDHDVPGDEAPCYTWLLPSGLVANVLDVGGVRICYRWEEVDAIPITFYAADVWMVAKVEKSDGSIFE